MGGWVGGWVGACEGACEGACVYVHACVCVRLCCFKEITHLHLLYKWVPLTLGYDPLGTRGHTVVPVA